MEGNGGMRGGKLFLPFHQIGQTKTGSGTHQYIRKFRFVAVAWGYFTAGVKYTSTTPSSNDVFSLFCRVSGVGPTFARL